MNQVLYLQAMRGFLKYGLLTLFKLLFVQSIISQEPVYKNFTMADGLPNIQVYDTYQDINGYLWFAAAVGVLKYDRKKFKIEKGSKNERTSLANL